MCIKFSLLGSVAWRKHILFVYLSKDSGVQHRVNGLEAEVLRIKKTRLGAGEIVQLARRLPCM